MKPSRMRVALPRKSDHKTSYSRANIHSSITRDSNLGVGETHIFTAVGKCDYSPTFHVQGRADYAIQSGRGPASRATTI